jgi:hypothetical protein
MVREAVVGCLKYYLKELRNTKIDSIFQPRLETGTFL